MTALAALEARAVALGIGLDHPATALSATRGHAGQTLARTRARRGGGVAGSGAGGHGGLLRCDGGKLGNPDRLVKGNRQGILPPPEVSAVEGFFGLRLASAGALDGEVDLDFTSDADDRERVGGLKQRVLRIQRREIGTRSVDLETLQRRL